MILSLTMVLCPDGLPAPEAWTAELTARGLDIVVHPTEIVTADWLWVPMSVRGHLAILWFHGLESLSRCRWWFPAQIPTHQKAHCVHMSFSLGGAYDVERERVAIWAAVASLPALSAALVFDRDGLREDLREIAYDIAGEMILCLPPRPHWEPGDPNRDLRRSSARRYDDGFDKEGGDRIKAERLEKAALQAIRERQQHARLGEGPEPMRGAGRSSNLHKEDTDP